jgi:lysophospholipase L1-like esterase
VQDPRDGQFHDVRAKDGFHLNQTGAEILALDIAEAIRTELRARGGKL